MLRGRGTKAAPEKAREIYEDACKNGSKVACGNLGDLLATGVGGPKDVVRAGELLAQGCEASGTHCVRLGDALSGSGALPKDALRSVESYQKGTRLLASQCNLGIADRCDDLGWLFHDGKAMPRDDAQALSYIRKGCTLGSPVGCNHLGLYLERGWGAEPNRAEAKKHYGTACESGVAEGCVSLGMLSSESERGSLMARACTAGSDLGCFESMRAARRDGKDDVARRGLEESCDRGFGRACSYLARWNKRDRVRDAKPWTQKLDEGCTKGDLGGCVTLAEVFDAGRAQQPDSESAKRIEPLARRACDGGEGRGCRLLSILAREGKAKQVSSGEASALLQKACDHGSQRSCIDIGKAVTATEPAKAASLFQRACEATDEPAPVMIVTLIRSIIEKEPPREPSVAAATGNGGARIGNSGSLAGLGSTGGTQGAGGVAMNSSGSIATDLARLGRKMTLTARAADALDADEPQTRDQQIGCGPLGELHEKGLGFVADKTRASGYYAQACTNEDGHACSRLAATYFDVKKQPTQAVFVQVLNKHACNLGDGDGCLEVAKLQASSKDRDERDEAPTTFDRACDLGSAEGCYRAGSGTLSRPDDETLEHFTQGCKLADARSCVAAAKLEERGFPDHPADKSAAKKLRAEACRLGEKSACK